MAMNTTRRKLAIATWGAPSEGNILGKLEVDVSEAISFINFARKHTERKITITHLVGKAVGLALAAAPGLNGRIVWGKYKPFNSVDIGFLVALEDGADLGKVKVENVDKIGIAEMADALSGGAGKLHKGEDEAFEKNKGLLRMLPTWVLRPLLKVTGWLTSAVGVNMPALGLEAFPFGSCIITNVGMFGLDEGYAPFTPFARVPVLVLLGSVKDTPCVRGGELGIRKSMVITATIDHRFVDGKDAARLAKIVRKTLENPWPLLGFDERPKEASLPPGLIE